MAKSILTKIVIAILLASMLLVSFAACGDDATTTTTKKPQTTNGPATTTQKPTVEKPAYPEQIIGMKDTTDGSVIEFIYVEGGNGTYTGDSIWVDPEAGVIDDVDTGVIERNNKIAEDLGVEISSYGVESIGIGGLQEHCKSIFDAQLPDIDVYCGYQYYDISLATQKHLYNLNDLVNANGDTIIDIEKDYWATNYINSITYNDYVYWVTGDLSLRYIGGLYCTFVNTEIYDTKVKAAYEGKTIYQIVSEGNWTMDTMIAMADLADDDADGDGKITEGEVTGFVYETNDIWDGMAFGCKVEFGKKVTTNGVDEITVNLHIDQKAKDFAKYCDQIYKSTFALKVADDDSKTMMPYFLDGLSLFAVNKIYQSAVWLSDMENFAIIPTPKLNNSQTNYASGCHDSLTIFGISKYSDVAEAAAATLELMAFYGSELVTPVFYEKYILGGRTVRDDESIEMINLIRKGFDSDFVAAWSNSLNNIVHYYRTPSQCTNYASIFKYNSTRWPKSLTTLLEQLEEAAIEE